MRGWEQHVSDEYEVLVYSGHLSGTPYPPLDFDLPTLPIDILEFPATGGLGTGTPWALFEPKTGILTFLVVIAACFIYYYCFTTPGLII